MIKLTVEELKAKIAELEAKDELTAEETDELTSLKEQLVAAEGGGTPSGGGSLNIGG